MCFSVMRFAAIFQQSVDGHSEVGCLAGVASRSARFVWTSTRRVVFPLIATEAPLSWQTALASDGDDTRPWPVHVCR